MHSLEDQEKRLLLQEKKLRNRTIVLTALIPLITVLVSVFTTQLTIQSKVDIDKLNFTQEKISELIKGKDLVESRKTLKFLLESDLIGDSKSKDKLLHSLEENLIDESSSTQNFLLGVMNFDSAYNSTNKHEIQSSYTKAINYFLKSLELNPRNYEARAYLGFSYFNLGNEWNLHSFYERSIQEYLKALEIDSTISYVYVDLADAYFNLGQTEKAIKYIKAVPNPSNLDSFRIEVMAKIKQELILPNSEP